MFRDQLKNFMAKKEEEGENNPKKKMENMVFFVVLLIITVVIINLIWNGKSKTDKVENRSNIETIS